MIIEQWGVDERTSMEGIFQGCTNLEITNSVIDTPNLSNVRHVISVFEVAISFDYWDVSFDIILLLDFNKKLKIR